MRTLGLIGGLSWESTALYYRLINEGVRQRLQRNHSASLLMQSYDFEPIAAAQRAGRWSWLAEQLVDAASTLEHAGAESIVICSNTMHAVVDEIEAAVQVPVLHVCEPVIAAARSMHVHSVGLLGTLFTMTQSFHKDRLSAGGLTVVTPNQNEMDEIHRIIYEELCAGALREASRAYLGKVIVEIQARGAEAIVLGCTELGLLVKPQDTALPLLDTTELHAREAVDWMLGGEQ